jgi:hypothetical protein
MSLGAMMNAPDSERTCRRLEEATAALIDRRILDVRGDPVPDRQADEVLIGVIATLLRAQLAARRLNGLGGWHVRAGQNEALKSDLAEHVANGSMLDAIRVAATIHARNHLFGPAA